MPETQPDILFANPTIISGDPTDAAYVASLLVSGGIIRAISPSLSLSTVEQDTRVVDCTGLSLCPGFIDLHAHSDLYLLTHGSHVAKLSQGVTTEVIGQDGIAYAPVETAEQIQAIREQIAGWNGNPSETQLKQLEADEGVSGLFEWRSVGEYLDKLEECGVATNVAMLVPQGNLRLLACGPYDVPATEEQAAQQVDLLRRSMEEGAIGMSSGLTYTPGMYATTAELATLCKTLADGYPGAYYAPHHRSYGLHAMASYGEMLQLSKDTGCSVHLTHATLNFPNNKGRAPELLEMIDTARAGGSDVTLDTYPYLPGCTTLAALLPSWASAGGPAETLKRLEDEVVREKIRVAMEVDGCDGAHGVPVDWSWIQVGTCSHASIAHCSGRYISEIAEAEQRAAMGIYFDIVVTDRLATSCLMHIGHEENVRMIIQHPTHCGGTDGILHGTCPHPRSYGTFPRFIGHYARDEGLMSIAEMISHVTYRPARRMGIWPHRGHVAVGSAADLVVFDPATIRDTATYEEPKRVAEGIKMVLVNGQVVCEEGITMKKQAGRVLRRRPGGGVQ